MLTTFSNVISHDKFDNDMMDSKANFTSSTTTMSQRLCASYSHGDAAATASSGLGVIRVHMKLFDDVDTSYITLGSKSEVLLGASLKSQYQLYDCPGTVSSTTVKCGGACVSAVQV